MATVCNVTAGLVPASGSEENVRTEHGPDPPRAGGAVSMGVVLIASLYFYSSKYMGPMVQVYCFCEGNTCKHWLFLHHCKWQCVPGVGLVPRDPGNSDASTLAISLSVLLLFVPFPICSAGERTQDVACARRAGALAPACSPCSPVYSWFFTPSLMLSLSVWLCSFAIWQ